MARSIEERTVALAGIFQASNLVKQLSHHGWVEQVPFESSLYSILTLDAPSTEAVYKGLTGVKMGLQILRKYLEKGTYQRRDMEVVRYVLGIILLERKLDENKNMLNIIRSSVEEIMISVEAYSISHPETVQLMANLYLNTLSTFNYRIQVKGEQKFLENPENINKVRALLLAGVRSAVLWRQKGGSRLQLLFSRAKTLQTTTRLLNSLNKQNL
jgi:high frequency lysogenization protein